MSNYPTRSVQEYYEKAVFISTGDYTTDTIGTGIAQLSRIQSVEFAATYPVEQQMYLNSANESWMNAPASVITTLRWFHTNGVNEQLIGLATHNPNGNWMLNLDTEKNLYVTVENTAGIDAIGASGIGQTKTVIGLGQSNLSRYVFNAAVGTIIQSEASFECLTSFIYSGQSGNQIPSVNYSDGSQLTGVFSLPPASSQYITNEPSGYLSTGSTDYVSAIAASDLVMTFPNATPFGVVLTGAQSCYLQSVNCSISIDRFAMKPMGYVYPSARPVVYPVHVDLTTDAIVSSYQADQLQRISCLGTGNWINVIVKQPCSNATLFGLYFTELQLISQNVTASIGRKDVVSFQWRAILSNPYQTVIDPTVNYIVRQDNSSPWGLTW